MRLDPERAKQETCPNAAEHTYGPDGYLAWHAWAARMNKTHTQHQCGCGYWLIYRPRGLRGLKAAS